MCKDNSKKTNLIWALCLKFEVVPVNGIPTLDLSLYSVGTPLERQPHYVVRQRRLLWRERTDIEKGGEGGQI